MKIKKEDIEEIVEEVVKGFVEMMINIQESTGSQIPKIDATLECEGVKYRVRFDVGDSNEKDSSENSREDGELVQ